MVTNTLGINVYAQHPYLVSLLFTLSLYSLIFNSQNFLFTCLPSFFTQS